LKGTWREKRGVHALLCPGKKATGAMKKDSVERKKGREEKRSEREPMLQFAGALGREEMKTVACWNQR